MTQSFKKIQQNFFVPHATSLYGSFIVLTFKITVKKYRFNDIFGIPIHRKQYLYVSDNF